MRWPMIIASAALALAAAAAIGAGVVKDVPTIRLVDDPAKVAAALRKHLAPAQLQALVALLGPTGARLPASCCVLPRSSAEHLSEALLR
jgi:hypothetical protein